MSNTFLQRIPEKYRVVGFLVATSVVGVILLLVGVYNASRELEIMKDVAELHRLASARAAHLTTRPGTGVGENLIAEVLGPDAELRLRGGRVTLAELEASRLGARGGLLETPGGPLAWTLVATPDQAGQLFLARPHRPLELSALGRLYSKRLFIPAAFYVWLMVWVGLIIRHFTARLASQKEAMEYMALHDTLSGLPNRNLLDDRLQQLIKVCERHPNRFALVLIDLDGFKAVNDRLGHDVGDGLLRQVGERLRNTIRAMDTAARVGGDEFVLLFDQVEGEDCVKLCDRLAQEIKRPFTVRDQIVTIGASIGVAEYPRDGEEPEVLRRNADIAMYRAKASGGGVRFYDAAMRTEVA